MAPRFFASPYKNAVAQIPKKDGWWSELPVSTSARSDSSSVIRATSEYWLAQGSSAGSLVCLPYDEPAKFGNKAPTLQVGSKAVTEFDASRFDDLLAVGADDGKFSVYALPALSDFADAGGSVSPSTSQQLSLASSRAVDILAFHPTTSSLLLAASQSTVALYDVSTASPSIELTLPSAAWSASWSYDGRLVSTTAKDGKLRLFDPRAGAAPIGETVAHPGLKASRHVTLKSEQVFTTGFSKMREREYALWDARSLARPVKSTRLDTGTGVLMPIADQERGIVYLAGKGDMTLRWIEVGGPTTFTEGVSQVSVQTAGIALAPPSALNLMKAEINRVLVLTSEAVVPIPIEVPRRQLIDFHQDLFPPVQARIPAQPAQEWLSGADALCDLHPQHPDRKPATVKRAAPNPLPAALSITHPIATTPAPASVAAPAVVPATVKEPVPTAALEGLSLSTPAEQPLRTEHSPDPASTPAPVSVNARTPSAPFSFKKADSAATAPGAAAPAPAPPAAAQAQAPARAPASSPSTKTTQSLTSKPSNPLPEHWSRNFLTGSSPLKPDYFGLNSLSVTMSADVPLLKANDNFAVFPLAGPGGRIAVHPLANKGRFPVNPPAFCAGATIVYFELDPFDNSRLFVAGDDGKIRVVRIPEAGLEEDVSLTEAVLDDVGMDKISELVPHPGAKGLLLSVSDDRGKAILRLWDLIKGEVARAVVVPSQVTSVAWSPDGSRLAVATKDKKLLVLDPRTQDQDSAPLSCPAHDSVRPTKLAWLSNTHIVSTGFTRGALRQLNLYSLEGDALKLAGQQALDQVPAPLFPFVDLDSAVLFLYSRGDRSCLAYEVQPTAQKPFTKLPSFEGATFQSGFAFLPKKGNDIKRVELVRGLRLSPATLEAVSWCVPRARAEFFQDDVYPHTRDTTHASLSATEWLAGRDAEPQYVSLRPEGMTPLSEAPRIEQKASTRDKISGELKLTESQKQEQYMSRLFAKAKEEESEDDDDAKPSHAPVQDEDDW